MGESSRASVLVGLCLLSACGGSHGGGVSDEGDAGTGAGEGSAPESGLYVGDRLQFRVGADGQLQDLDLHLACTCDGVPQALDGRVRDGVGLESDGVTLKTIVSGAAHLQLSGAFTDSTRAEGRYTFYCCADVPWSADRVDEGAAAPGVCTGSPDTSPAPLSQSAAHAALHWTALDTCIGLTYAPEAAPAVARIQAAADAWGAVECSPICFGVAQPADAGPVSVADRRIHFQGADIAHPLPSGALAATSVLAVAATGEIDGAVVVLSEETLAATGENELLRQVGRALGFDQAPEGTGAALSASGASERLTTADTASLCAVYGDTPYCAD